MSPWNRLKKGRLDLQAKIVLVLVGVILPTFLLVTVAENKLTLPLLEDEVRQVSINRVQSLADYILDFRLFDLRGGKAAIEERIEAKLQELLYIQPSIVRMDVFLKNSAEKSVILVASNFEIGPDPTPDLASFGKQLVTERIQDETGNPYWKIEFPLIPSSTKAGSVRAPVGWIRAWASLQLVTNVLDTFWKTTAAAAAFSVVALIAVLSFFLRRTIENDRKLLRVESTNVELSSQLHDAQRKLVTHEKLAVMGQLTATFAHEIGTPLNAVNGHLQLLEEDISLLPSGEQSEWRRRIEVIQGQIQRIAGIVQSFLQSTARPPTQVQLVDPNPLIDRCLKLVEPRIRALGVQFVRNLDPEISPVRLVPSELEQILLNLLNNALDSLQLKAAQGGGRSELTLSSSRVHQQGRPWVRIEVGDSGVGIPKAQLQQVLKPFFTTKPVGSGTGLGLTICRELARKANGDLRIESKEGSWTRVSLEFPAV